MFIADTEKKAEEVSLFTARFRAIFEKSPTPCQILTPLGRIIGVNEAWQKLWGLSSSDLKNVVLNTYTLFDDPQLDDIGIISALRRGFSGETVTLPAVHYDPAKNNNPGRARWVQTYIYPIKNFADQVEEVIMVQEDFTEQKETREELQNAVNHYKALAQAAPVGIFESDGNGDCFYVNKRWSEIAGMTQQQAVGQGWKQGLHPDDLPWITTLWYETARKGGLFKAQYRFMRPDGNVTWVYGQAAAKKNDHGEVVGYVGTITDISEQKEYEEALRRQATTDNLTGLSNRVTALDRLTLAVSQAHRDRCHAVLMFVDLDHFKHINDSLGHQAGDELLSQSAARLQACVREGHTVARFGGDEFLIIMPALDKTEYAETVAQRVIKAFERPFSVGGNEVFVSASLGLAVYPEDGCDAESLLCHADAALYRVKESGRNTYCFFLEEMNKKSHERLHLETQLRYALERTELAVHYQPVMDTKTGRLCSVEALLRWHNPLLGKIDAEQFIPLAEETGLIVPIGDWVLHTACREIQQWIEQTGQPIRLAVNLSPRQFRAGAIVSSVESALSQSCLPPDCLELELTERMLVMEESHEILHKLRALGVRLSIDDFGTGYSSLSYLTRLPISYLKVDQSFIQDVPHRPESAIVARGIIALSHSLGLQVIGECVENDEQLRFLQDEGCDYVQGFYFCPALPIAELEDWTKCRVAWI